MVIFQEHPQQEEDKQPYPEKIPRIVFGNIVYTNYPIRKASR